MIDFEKVGDKYFVFSDKDIWKYGPFDNLWVKWVFSWENFVLDTKNLKSWKNAVWIFNWKLYLFEEKKWKLIYF